MAEKIKIGIIICDRYRRCAGGNIEYAGDEMVKNGVSVIHLATGLVVGYPPCPYIKTFQSLLEKKFSIKVVIGTHPIPEKYMDLHTKMGTWDSEEWKPIIEPTLSDKEARLDYN